MKKMKLLCICFVCANLLIACANNNHSELNKEEKSTVEAVSGTEEKQQVDMVEGETEEQSESVKSYETLADMKAVIIDYIENTYTDGSVIYDSDEYNDTTYVGFNGDDMCTTIKKDESGYALILYPSMVAVNKNGKPCFGFSYMITYGSASFLDYLFDSDCIFLAEDGTKCSYPIYKIRQYDDSIYFTDMFVTFDETQREELDSLYEIIQKEGVSMRINQLNINDEYITVDLDEATKKSIKKGIELYYELYDVLY